MLIPRRGLRKLIFFSPAWQYYSVSSHDFFRRPFRLRPSPVYAKQSAAHTPTWTNRIGVCAGSREITVVERCYLEVPYFLPLFRGHSNFSAKFLRSQLFSFTNAEGVRHFSWQSFWQPNQESLVNDNVVHKLALICYESFLIMPTILEFSLIFT